MKKGLILTTALAMALGVGVAVSAHQTANKVEALDAGKAVYLLPNSDWVSDSARFALYSWSGEDQNQTWTNMSAAAGTSYYTATIPATAEKVIFCRMNGSEPENKWDNKWNQSGNLTLSEASGNVYKITGWNESGEWAGDYDPDDEPASDGYYIVGTASNWKFTGATKMGAGDDDNYAKLLEYEATKDEEFKVRKYENHLAIGWYGIGESGDNYVASASKKVNVYMSKDGKVYVEDWVAPKVDPVIKFFYKGSEVGNYEHRWMFDGAEASKIPTAEFDVADLSYTVSEGATAAITWEVNEVNVAAPTNPVPGHTYAYRVTVSADATYNAASKYMLFTITDEAASNGYYLVGSKTNFTYVGATKMIEPGENVEGNEAVLYGYDAVGGEKIKVRKFNSAAEPKDTWSFYTDGEKTYGDVDEDANFRFSTAGRYDIFAKTVSEQLRFYVVPHVDRYTVSFVDRFFEGSLMTTYENNPETQLATAGQGFTPTAGHHDGYVFRGYFTNNACTTRFVDGTVLDDDTVLQAKYTKIGYYITGDATYAGSEELAWNVDGAKILSDTVNDPANMLEGSVTIPNSASKVSPVKVKALHYVYDSEHPLDGKWEAMNFNMGAEYSFIELDEDSNFCFSKGGTYAIYVKLVNYVPTVWVNEGIEAFHTKFLSEVGATCTDIVGGTKTMEQLKTVWADQKAAYQSLSADEKAVFSATNIDAGNEDGTQIEKVIAKYSYIVHKYGTSNFEDFIWGQSYDPNSLGVFNYKDVKNNSTLIYVIAALSAVTLGVGLVVVLKKKKEN